MVLGVRLYPVDALAGPGRGRSRLRRFNLFFTLACVPELAAARRRDSPTPQSTATACGSTSREKGDIAERYRDQGHPQFWGIIAGTSANTEDAQWMLKQYQRIGLSDTRIQSVTFFHPQWSAESWEVAATTAGKAVSLISAQPAYATASTDGKVLDLAAVYAGLGSEADFAGRDVHGKAVVLVKDGVRGAGDALRRAQDKGAVAIFSADSKGGNYSFQSLRVNTTVPTFNLGTEDGVTLREAIGKAFGGEASHRGSRSASTRGGCRIRNRFWCGCPTARRDGRDDLRHRAPRWLVPRCWGQRERRRHAPRAGRALREDPPEPATPNDGVHRHGWPPCEQSQRLRP